MFAPTAQIRPKVSRLKLGVVFGTTVLALAFLWQQVQHIDFGDVQYRFGQIGPWHWIYAFCASVASFAALGRYDSLWHRALDTGIDQQTARRTGMMAIAIGQTLGMASFVAGLVRWQRLPDLPATTILKLSAAVSISFTLCWALLALPALWWIMGPETRALPSPYIVGVILIAMGFAGRRLCDRYGVAPAMAFSMLGWTCLDLACAALVIYAVLPESVPVTSLIAAVIIAMGAGLLSNTPGGIGTFDLALMALLPSVPVEALVSALLAYRLTYFLIPFVIAAALLVRQPLRRIAAPHNAPPIWTLARQSGSIMGGKTWAAFMGQTALGPISIGTPIGPLTDWAEAIGSVYKCDVSTAAVLRRRGWSVARIACEARIDPQSFSLVGSQHQSLRRKLRKAEAAGITIRAGQPRLDEAARVATAWARDHGGELGFSMGRFDPILIAAQRVFLIVQDNDLKGFITCHEGRDGWALDLIRYVPNLPDGAMHAAVIAAIASAKDANVNTLCLGAVPSFDGPFARLDRTRSGLLQFKRSFTPTWHPVYHAARNPAWFALTGIAVTLAIQRPLANLPYQAQVMKIMQRFQLPPTRARGIAKANTIGPAHDDKCTDNPA